MRKLTYFGLLISCLYFAGCSTYAANRYSISPDNVVVLRQHVGVEISVEKFTSTEPGLTELPCRMVGPIQTPDKTTFEEFIRQAFIDELQISELYNTEARIVLTGNLDKISFSSTSGKWEIGLTVVSNNSKSISIFTEYDYSTSMWGETACNQTAQALVPAVQEVIKALVTHEDFVLLLNVDEDSEL